MSAKKLLFFISFFPLFSTFSFTQQDQTHTFHHAPKALDENAVTTDWVSFLGPNGNATTPETKILKISPNKGPDLIWERVAGSGFSSPAILGDKLVYIHRVKNHEQVDCINALTGKLLWSINYLSSYRDRFGFNDGPRSSPIIDDDKVFTLGAEGKLHCLNLKSGAILWKKDLVKTFNVPLGYFGIGTTPLLEKEKLIISTGIEGGASVIAFNKSNGEIIWKTKEAWGLSYASPVAATIHGKRIIGIFAGGESDPTHGGLLLIDAESGKLLDRFPWRSEKVYSVNASNPVVIDDKIILTESYTKGAVCLQINKKFKAIKLWENPECNLHFTTGIEDNGYLYGFRGQNIPQADLAGINLKTGKIVWSEAITWTEQLPGISSRRNSNPQPRTFMTGFFRGSLLKVEDFYLAIGEDGHLATLKLSPKGPEILSRKRLFHARQTWSLPVLSKGLLYVCQNEPDYLSNKPPRLLCYDLRGK